MTLQARPWTESFRVRSYEVDPRGRASVLTLCNYLQEAAANHAQEIGVSRENMLEQGTAWVLAHLHVQIDRYPQWGDTVQVETWPSGTERLYATREFLLRDEAGSSFGRATSAWLVIDVERRRPVRLPAALHDIELPDRDAPLSTSFDRLLDLDRVDHECRFRVRFSDLDLNQHVNNVQYAEWALEALPDDVLTQQRLVELKLQFRSETTLGDGVTAQTQRAPSDGTLQFLHRVLHAADERVVARAQTRWTDAP